MQIRLLVSPITTAVIKLKLKLKLKLDSNLSTAVPQLVDELSS